MGFRSRIKAKIKGAIGNVDALAKVIHDEANHPGRPQPHMAAKNPLWGGEHSEVEKESEEFTEELAEEEISEEKPTSTEQTEDEFWFLKHDDEEGDDWSKVNPKAKPKKEN